MTLRVMFYVQHLLGIGHVVRALRITRALKANGFDVLLIMGGMPVDGMDLSDINVVQMPPVQSGTDGFTDLIAENGQAADERFWTERTNLLISRFRDFKPDILLIEAYPFGRRQMRFELLPLLSEVAKRDPKPVVAASIRDILQENRKQKRLEETVDILNQYFDLVLVHGDERYNQLEETFPLAHKIKSDIVYTGIVSGPQPLPASDSFDIIVSAGGGAVGGALLQASLKAQPLTSLAGKRWLFVTGPNLPRADFENLKKAASANIRIERYRDDLAALFYTAKISISQCGYNTVADILRAGCASVVIPFAAGGETEQTRRAEALYNQGRLTFVRENTLTPETLVTAFEEALTLNINDQASNMRLDGADNSTAILRSFVQKRLSTP